ncbi:21995_t:CDS:2, partial [Gigaspora rosea]
SKKRPNTNTTNRRLTNSCHVGWCNKEERLNACRARHRIAQVEKVILGAQTEANKIYYFDTLWNRIFFHRFFQEKQENQVITPLQIDYNLQNIPFKKNVTVHLQNEFTEDEMTLCMDLNKLQDCVLSEKEDQARVFDKGNYAIVMILDYMDWMYQFKKQDSKNNNAIISALGDSGILSFLSDGYLEAAYMPDMKHSPTFNTVFQSITDCFSKKLQKINSNCVVGVCGNEKRINNCCHKKDYEATVDKEFDFRPQIENIGEGNNAKERTYIFPIHLRMLLYNYFK